MFIIDSHQDMAWNMITFNRDYTLSSAQIRQVESGRLASQVNGDTLLGWPDFQRGRVAVIFATLFAAPLRSQEGEWDTQCYADINQANHMYRTQMDAYARLTNDHPDKYRLVHTQSDLREIMASWEAQAGGSDEGEPTSTSPVGLIILMEGGEGVRDPGELDDWWQHGVRIIGPAWKGTRYCGGTDEPGALTLEGYSLLEGMADRGFALDLSHMDEKAALQALDAYPGTIIATHSNARALLKGSNSNRHLSDQLIQGIFERDGVIGVVPYNAFLKYGWRRGDRRGEVALGHLVAQIDYYCQMAGDAHHVGIGSDFDGGFGLQSAPLGINSIADLHILTPLLTDKGYTPEDIAAIFGCNWLRCTQQILPESL